MEPLSQLIPFFIEYGYLAVFGVLLACGFGLPVPEDVTLVAGGIISGLHYTNVHIMFVVGMGGVIAGDSIVFTVGWFLGQKVFELPLIKKHLTPARFQQIQEKFMRHGRWVIFVARFMPGLRTPIFLTAGATRRVSFLNFLALDGLAALISVPIWVYLGYLGAENRDWLARSIERGQVVTVSLLGAIALGALIVFFIRKRNKKQCQAQTLKSKTLS